MGAYLPNVSLGDEQFHLMDHGFRLSKIYLCRNVCIILFLGKDNIKYFKEPRIDSWEFFHWIEYFFENDKKTGYLRIGNKFLKTEI